MKSPKHPGFKAVANRISQREDVSMASARRILAAAGRGASPAAKQANPRLNKIGGQKRGR